MKRAGHVGPETSLLGEQARAAGDRPRQVPGGGWRDTGGTCLDRYLKAHVTTVPSLAQATNGLATIANGDAHSKIVIRISDCHLTVGQTGR